MKEDGKVDTALLRRLKGCIDRLAQAEYKKARATLKVEALSVLDELVKHLEDDKQTRAKVATAKLLTSVRPSTLFRERKYYVANPSVFESAIDELKELYNIEEIEL